MALKDHFTVATVFLLLLLLATPGFSKVGDEVYEIDYRGPETHTSPNPPNHPGGHRPFIHRQIAAGNRRRNAKKLHG